MTYRPRPGIVHLERDFAIKRFRSAQECETEARWFRRFPWAAPELVVQDGPDMMTRRYPVAWETSEWRDAHALKALILRLFAEGVHHRDVHLRNIVLRDGQPLLIDWYTAIDHPSPVSYDLYGRRAALPKPEGHIDHQCWDTPNPYSIKEAWGVGLSDVGL